VPQKSATQEENMKNQLQLRMDMAVFLQDTVGGCVLQRGWGGVRAA
jgi:hypothetical protein